MRNRYFLIILLCAVIFVSFGFKSQDKKETKTVSPWTQAPGREMATQSERDFLVKLTQNIKNDTIASQLSVVSEKLKTSPRLEQRDFDFLMTLSKNINNPKISGVLEQIAQRHRP